MLSALIAVGFMSLGVLLDRAWLWVRAERAHAYHLFSTNDAERQAMSDIAARTRRAEEQMRRVAFRGWMR
jgi:CRISPR/Cas system-associated protein Csm6